MTGYAFTHLRHFAIAVPDYRRQLDFYTGHWGLSVAATDGDVTYLAAEGCLKGMPRVAEEREDSVDDEALLEPCEPPDIDAVTRWVLVGRDGLEAMGYFDFTDELPPHPPDS